MSTSKRQESVVEFSTIRIRIRLRIHFGTEAITDLQEIKPISTEIGQPKPKQTRRRIVQEIDLNVPPPKASTLVTSNAIGGNSTALRTALHPGNRMN